MIWNYFIIFAVVSVILWAIGVSVHTYNLS